MVVGGAAREECGGGGGVLGSDPYGEGLGVWGCTCGSETSLRTKLYYRRTPLKRKEEGDGGEEMGIHMLF